MGDGRPVQNQQIAQRNSKHKINVQYTRDSILTDRTYTFSPSNNKKEYILKI